ncbi:hypothetical protein C0995_001796 [Termitomyces sp. Mi166|nr:hypothetical protein C0995_001796 [Termitomyces sp. Mi166\
MCLLPPPKYVVAHLGIPTNLGAKPEAPALIIPQAEFGARFPAHVQELDPQRTNSFCFHNRSLALSGGEKALARSGRERIHPRLAVQNFFPDLTADDHKNSEPHDDMKFLHIVQPDISFKVKGHELEW